MPGAAGPRRTLSRGRSSPGTPTGDADRLKAATPPRDGAAPPLLLLASPDDYLLELERGDAVTAWAAAHPDGETTVYSEAPPAARLVRELASPSLFASARLLVVTDARPYLSPRGQDGDELAEALATMPLADATLVLAAISESEPSGALVEAIVARGAARFLPLPPAPKPWDQVRISPAQRAVLEGIIRRVAPAILVEQDVVDVLLDAYGFRPRELAQAAERLTLSGDIDAETVRIQRGPGERSLKELEDALIDRDIRAVASLFAALASGATLLGWYDAVVEPDRLGRALSGFLARLLRTALAVRRHAGNAGLLAELDPARCRSSFWYPREYKNRLHARLMADVDATPDSPLAGLSPWNAHRAFRLAAAYSERELLTALAGLAASGAEIARPAEALPALDQVAIALVAGGPPARRAFKPGRG